MRVPFRPAIATRIDSALCSRLARVSLCVCVCVCERGWQGKLTNVTFLIYVEFFTGLRVKCVCVLGAMIRCPRSGNLFIKYVKRKHILKAPVCAC